MHGQQHIEIGVLLNYIMSTAQILHLPMRRDGVYES